MPIDRPEPAPVYRPADGDPSYPGASREDWIGGWTRMPGWNEIAAQRAFDMLIGSGAMVEVPRGFTERERLLWAAKEAYRFHVDATDDELADYGMTRLDALRKARELDLGLPDGLKDDGLGRWARENLRRVG